ncbi:hypothetical protein AURDEDRAFT_129115 [Auricularia subglabra TFB-10046 SS5]|nr:hypothetical protein AURDEDRAFT_129115 [Auricularia subglabra TFB-10046 SS5]
MTSLSFDNISLTSSVPSLEPCSASTFSSPILSAGPDTPQPFSDDNDDIIIITDRTKFDPDAGSARLRETGQFAFMINICPTADRAARLFLHFHIADTEHANSNHYQRMEDDNMRTFRINWRWVRGLVYVDDRAFWPASFADLDPAIVPDGEQHFAYRLNGTFTRCALDVHDLSGAGTQPPRDCPHARVAHTTPEPPRAPTPPPSTILAPLLPFHALAVAITFVFSAGTRALRRFYIGANQERVTINPNWLSTDKLVEFANIPFQNARTPAWVKEHCSEWLVKEVVTCNAANLCGIDYKLRLTDNSVIWIRDDTLEWITGATEAVRAFWEAGHCLRPDIAEKLLHQRPIAYCTLAWDAALLEWTTRQVNAGHAYRIVNGRVRTAI